MVKKKAVIFIDANNWYHNVKNIVRPSDIDIKKIVDLICSKHDYNPLEIRWYVSTPSIQDGEAMYYRHLSFLSNLKKQGIEVITRKLQRLSNKEVQTKRKELIESLEFCKVCKPLVEENFLEFADLKRKEKGIDVWIAIDMINKCLIEKSCDVCILISGDADFVPALKLIQESKKEVLSSFVPIGYSYELRNKFKFFFLGKGKIMDCLKDYKDIKKK